MSRSHYETLGVGSGASADEIKRAYRQRISAAHPDREGGSADAAAAINRAYLVLSDPEARRRYDENGSDRPEPSRQALAEARLATVFNELIDRHEGKALIVAANDVIVRAQERMTTQIQNLEQEKQRLTGRLKVWRRTDDAPNLVDNILRERIRDLDKKLVAVRTELEVSAQVLVALADYDGEQAAQVDWGPKASFVRFETWSPTESFKA